MEGFFDQTHQIPGHGCPDVSLLGPLAEIFGVPAERLLAGSLDPNETEAGNMRKLKFYVCPDCGNILTSSGPAELHCCGRRLEPLAAAPADEDHGVMGVGSREINYLYGEYRHLKGCFENGVLTGKGFASGGSLIRPEATGFGAVYYLENVLRHFGEDLKGKTIACAGFGNVTWGICRKAAELGAKVVTLSGPDGYIYDPDGINTAEKIDYILKMRASGRDKVRDYADQFGVEFHGDSEYSVRRGWSEADQ